MNRTPIGLSLTVAVALCSSAGVLSAARPDVFTLAIVPDTQQETVSTSGRFNNRTQWLADHKDTLNLKMVLQVGDMMNWDTPDHIQFVRADQGLDILDNAGIPYALAVGNHDTAAVMEGGSAAPGNVNTNLRNTSTFNSFFPPARFANLGGTYQAGKMDNAWQTFRAGNLDWLVLNLELWPRAAAVNWAKTVVENHPDHNVIILTHHYLNSNSTIGQTNGGYGDNSPQYLFDQLIKQYDNIRLVFSGHVGTHGYRTDQGVKGNKIYSLMQTYHDNSTNPVRLLEIDVTQGTMASRIYAPWADEYKNDGSTFTITGVQWVPAVPEPASLSMLGVGVCVAFRRCGR
ncbi:MAG: metallophosphoesterase [Phycisphaeraceae bacterium]|nr:metallophosphoesterase [Phycisphaeraceae bacterium]